VDTDSSDDDNPDQINQTWSRNLKKPQVADFREQQRIPFIRHCLQRARLFIHFHSSILEICVTKYRKRKYHMAEKSFLKMNFISSPFELSKNLTNRSRFNNWE
jgi:hypothetical protein